MCPPSSDWSVSVVVAFLGLPAKHTSKKLKDFIYVNLFPNIAPQRRQQQLWANIHIEALADGGEKKATRETLNTAAGLRMQHYSPADKR